MNENYVEQEELFGFHSEYYIYPEWWKWNGVEEGIYSSARTIKGYTEFSEYKNDI